MSWFRDFWLSRKTHQRILQDGAQTREKLLKLAVPYSMSAVEAVVEATEQAADFKK